MNRATVQPGPGAGSDVTAVVVTWRPDLDRLAEQFRRLQRQVGRIVVVDNGSPIETLTWLRNQVARADGWIVSIELGRNLGVAAAQNRGIDRAIADGSRRILLLDHDSLPGGAMVSSLSQALDDLEANGLKVAAVGPCYLDERQQNPPPFIRVRGGRLHRLPCPSPETINEVDYLIASGSLIPVAALEATGRMDERLFIDYVDIEWGLRARNRGWLSYGVCGASMEHDLGEEPIVVLGRALPSHSPLRHYYHFRNAVWLYLHGTAPREWKLVDGYRLVLRFGFYALFAKPRLSHVRAMISGIRDGLRGVTGPRPAPAGAGLDRQAN